MGAQSISQGLSAGRACLIKEGEFRSYQPVCSVKVPQCL